MRTRIPGAMSALALACLFGCGGYDSQNNSTQNTPQNAATQNGAQNSSTRTRAISEPEFNQNVKDDATCQPVRNGAGAALVACKGTCPSAASRCGKLQSRPRGGGGDVPYTNDNGTPYDSSREYRCVCQSAG
ncbi:MAG: hypothetical protein LC785_07190 [Acidobacteria bacterium]|nr:hypothetical protein [Acidobacteriota bacterium]